MPVELEWILSKALEKDREMRYQTAADFRADLRRLKRDLVGSGPEFRMPVPIYLELANRQIARLNSARPIGNMTVEQKVPLKGVKEKPGAR